MRLLEWVGQASLFDDPRVEYKMLTGQLTPQQLVVLRHATRWRVYRVVGKSIRIADPRAFPGLSKSYSWGPQKASYVQPVEDNDARIILASTSRDEWRDVTHGKPPELRLPSDVLQPVVKEHYRDVADFGKALRGLAP